MVGHRQSKTSRTPRRPFEKERLDQEIKLIGEYGLKNKREVWRVQYTLSKVRAVARQLLTLDEKDPRRIFEGGALIRRLHRSGILEAEKNQLDFVLNLSVENFLDRRLQTLVLKLGHAKSMHHARVLVRQGHIRVGGQIVDVPSFMVRIASEKYIAVSERSPYGGDNPGRVARRNAKKRGNNDDDEE
mmetsp:Transcript_128506/g.181258  ORF Transcript_128506/g.181258 Transcript_128506/m.181258 type:complete len:187 (+) Transcript_128506:36-596(+)